MFSYILYCKGPCGDKQNGCEWTLLILSHEYLQHSDVILKDGLPVSKF